MGIEKEDESPEKKLNLKLNRYLLMLGMIQDTRASIKEFRKNIKKVDKLIGRLEKNQPGFGELLKTVGISRKFLKAGNQHYIDSLNHLRRVKSDVNDELKHTLSGKDGLSRNKLLRHFFSEAENKTKADRPTSWYVYVCSELPEFRTRFDEPDWVKLLDFFKKNPTYRPPRLKINIKPGALRTRVTRYTQHCEANYLPKTIVMSKAIKI